VEVRCDLGTELRIGRVAVAFAQVTEDLVIGAVLLDDHHHVLDRRAPAEMRRDDLGHGVVVALVDRADL
jgi:hypothetical protein